MTDKCVAEINALQKVWPASWHLLCWFHVSQYVWEWVHENEHGIDKEDRRNLLLNFQRLLYSSTEEEAETHYEVAKALGEKYPQWIEYLAKQWEIKEKWCQAYRHRITKGNNTNNYAEVTIRLFKDLVLERFKMYNLV